MNIVQNKLRTYENNDMWKEYVFFLLPQFMLPINNFPSPGLDPQEQVSAG